MRCIQRKLAICGAAVELRIAWFGAVDVDEYIVGVTGATAVPQPSPHLSLTVSLSLLPSTRRSAVYHTSYNR